MFDLNWLKAIKNCLIKISRSQVIFSMMAIVLLLTSTISFGREKSQAAIQSKPDTSPPLPGFVSFSTTPLFILTPALNFTPYYGVTSDSVGSIFVDLFENCNRINHKSFQEFWDQLPWTVIATGTSASALFVLLLILVSFGGNWKLSLSFLMAGIAIGWLLGILISPTTDDQQSTYQTIGKIISALVSGFILGHASEAIKEFFRWQNLIKREVSVISGIFVSSLIMVFLLVTVSRLNEKEERDRCRPFMIPPITNIDKRKSERNHATYRIAEEVKPRNTYFGIEELFT